MSIHLVGGGCTTLGRGVGTRLDAHDEVVRAARERRLGEHLGGFLEARG